MGAYIQVYTTLETKKDAESLVRKLVEKRLVACAQVLGPISSTYWWQGEIQVEEEWLCVMKSREDLYQSLEKAIKGLHPYEEPEILAAPVIAGSRSYLGWLDEQVVSP